MQLNRFDLNLLIALDALLREKNVTRAAERVFLSQPAMSAALQKLRIYFNDPLLVRVGRDLQLTPKGLSLVEPVHEVLLRVQATLATQPAFDPGSARQRFTLVLASPALVLLGPRLLERLAREARGVSCHFESLDATSLARLEYGDADLCIALDDPGFFAQRHWPEWLRSAALRSVRWSCIADRDNVLVDAGLDVERLRALPRAVAQSSSADASPAAGAAPPDGTGVRASADSLLSLPFLVIGTPLVASIPERLAHEFAARLPLKVVPDPERRGEEQELALWHKRREPDPAHAWFRELVIGCARTP
ncbi:MAG: LysR family transcriptional regulator [Gammaproteobacteria bacterium]|nr:LysR family transcriptional regulator [Gammaproteobacteria bacterium]